MEEEQHNGEEVVVKEEEGETAMSVGAKVVVKKTPSPRNILSQQLKEYTCKKKHLCNPVRSYRTYLNDILMKYAQETGDLYHLTKETTRFIQRIAEAAVASLYAHAAYTSTHDKVRTVKKETMELAWAQIGHEIQLTPKARRFVNTVEAKLQQIKEEKDLEKKTATADLEEKKLTKKKETTTSPKKRTSKKNVALEEVIALNGNGHTDAAAPKARKNKTEKTPKESLKKSSKKHSRKEDRKDKDDKKDKEKKKKRQKKEILQKLLSALTTDDASSSSSDDESSSDESDKLPEESDEEEEVSDKENKKKTHQKKKSPKKHL